MNNEYDDQGVEWRLGRRVPLTVTEYAAKHHTSRQYVLLKIKKGKIKAFRAGSIWLIPDND